MRVGAIIAEFNPLHRGHLHLINEANKNCDVLVVLLSGYFSQRGEPVCQDKWMRAKDTIDAGADLVLTHPVYTATSPAREFSEGAISILTELPHLEALFFGMERSGLEVYHQGLDVIEDNLIYREALKDYLNQGMSYSVATREALASVNPNLLNLFQPNSILGLEYGKSLRKRDLFKLSHPIQRISSWDGYPLPSASKLRHSYNMKIQTKSDPFQFNPQNMVNTDRLQEEKNQLYRGNLMSDELDLSLFLGYEVGIEAHLKKQAIRYASSATYFEHAKSKRYSIPRLKRLLLHNFLNMRQSEVHEFQRSPKAIQVLGFSKKGQNYLRECQQLDSLFFITNYKQLHACPTKVRTFYEMELRSSNLYHLLMRSNLNQDMLRHPYIKKS